MQVSNNSPVDSSAFDQIKAKRQTNFNVNKLSPINDRNDEINSILSNCRVALLTLDKQQVITAANGYCSKLLGVPRTSLLGSPFPSHLSSESYLSFVAEFNMAISQKNAVEITISITTGNGASKTLLALMSGVEMSSGCDSTVSLVLVDSSKQKNKMSELSNAKRYLERLANNDALTGLSNRMRFKEELRNSLLHARKHRRKVALLYFDLDGFKKINDHFGHHAGDAVLCKIANRLRSLTREEGKIARLGGDEFAMIIEFAGDITPVEAEANRILELVKEPIHLQSATVELKSSIGICVYPDGANTPEILIQQSDASMYEAKKLGGDRVSFFTSELYYELVRRTKLERGIDTGLEQLQFSVKYQPIVSVANGDTHSYEALLRWNHPEYGNVAPSEFIALAERTGEIVKLGYWVLDRACQFLRNISKSNSNVKFAINLSPVQFSDHQLIDNIHRCFDKYNVSPERIDFEITETCIFTNSRESLAVAKAIKEMGCGLSIDDFGTGYSSFSRLMEMPASKLKIDRSLIKKITVCNSYLSIVRGIIEMAHNLRMDVVAEGVETTQQMELLTEIKCDYLQGWLVQVPAMESDILSDVVLPGKEVA